MNYRTFTQKEDRYSYTVFFANYIAINNIYNIFSRSYELPTLHLTFSSQGN